jgi:ribosomal protein S18 acetylase RimI-like enzyme
VTIATFDTQSPERESQVIHAMTLAFVRDPVMRWIYPEPEAYLTHFPGFTGAFGGPSFRSETAWLSDDLGGAAMWFPPGVSPDGEAVESHLNETVPPERIEALGATLGEMEAHHPDEPHWYLAVIGVDAAHQGKGLGASLMQEALARCDEAGLIAYLESSNPANISLYERHGFRVMAEIQHGDVPPVFPMLRPAR